MREYRRTLRGLLSGFHENFNVTSVVGLHKIPSLPRRLVFFCPAEEPKNVEEEKIKNFSSQKKLVVLRASITSLSVKMST